MNITLNVLTPTETRITVSTSTPGTIAGYSVTMTNVTMDSTCANNPIAGSVTVSQGGSSYTQNFTATCVAIPATPVAILPEIKRNVTRVFTPSRSE